jgi:hypothetical protein
MGFQQLACNWQMHLQLLLPLLSFDRPAPADVWPRRANGGPGGAPLDRSSSRLLREGRDAIEGRTTWTDGGPTLCSRGAEKAGRSPGVHEADTLTLGRAKREVDPHSPSSPLTPMLWGEQALGSAGRGRAAASWGMRATRAPGTRRRGRPRSGRPQAPLKVTVEESFTEAYVGVTALCVNNVPIRRRTRFPVPCQATFAL